MIDLKRLIEESDVFKEDYEFVKSVIEQVLEEVKTQKSQLNGEIELERLKLEKVKAELELARFRTSANNSETSLNGGETEASIDFDTLKEPIVSDKMFQTIDRETAAHINIRQSGDWFRPLQLGKECDLYFTSSGAEATLANIRTKFWIVNGRSKVKRVIKQCIKCLKVSAKGKNQMMADLASARSHSFRNCNLSIEAVLVKGEDNSKLLNWNLAKIVEVHPGTDDITRVVTLKTGIDVPSVPMLRKIMSDALEEAKVDLDDIEYVEAHGAGTQIGDGTEANALGQIFCKNRRSPLLIGTIKGNIGHTEASSAICGIIKSLIAFETSRIPPSIKYETPNPNAPDLVEGRLKVVTEPTTLNSNYIPVNSLGLGGTLVQTILKRNPITTENRERTNISIPRLVLYPATTEEGINFVFDYVQFNPDLPDEFFALLHKLSFCTPVYKPYRGYALFQEEKSRVTEIKNVSPNERQIWYVMTGMGCQWPGMGLDHMKIDVFAESMHRSAEILKPYGIDLLGLLKSGIKDDHDDRKITVSFVTICAIQIALLDLLKHLDVSPDGMVGHSAGELLCAYADGCLTHEQTLLSFYYRGQSVENSNIPQGGMAAVGLSWSQVQKICPEGIYPACDNATDSITISGEKEPLEKFVEKLKQDNIFVRLVNSHGYGFHCKHVYAAGPALRKAQEKVSVLNFLN
ncbi:fatty acid synthase [Trichonephila clavata]|uniref:Fatty acid synthase n=1 Tax=Trichonephila clavata TaxID=2740835 RepID=A0A8X6G578_TRICU|nr:fatty acid synthase [Trichonephila clavata]